MLLLLTSLLVFIIVFIASVDIARRIYPQSLPLSLPVGYVILISVQVVIFNILSLFHMVNFYGTLFAEIIFMILWIFYLIYKPKKFFSDYLVFLRQRHYRYLIILLPLLCILLFIGLVYPPNNNDSMVYHMARVAHWIQNCSIDYYHTGLSRQNQMGPGAEYLILLLQILSNSDIFANIVQFFAYLILVMAIGDFGIAIGLSKRIIFPVAIIVSCSPMAILQATSTQNDLVAAVVALACIITIIPFFKNNNMKLNPAQLLLIGVVYGVSIVTKPTSTLAVFPVILYVFFANIFIYHKRVFLFSHGLRLLLPLISFAVIVFPDILRKFIYTGHPLAARHEVFPFFAEWNFARLRNLVYSVAHNFYFYNEYMFRMHEDWIQNPFQFICAAIFAVAGIFFILSRIEKRKIDSLKLFFLITPFLSLCVFGFILKMSPWVSRKELPIIFLIPFVFTIYPINGCWKKSYNKIIILLLNCFAIICFVQGILCALNNETRPFSIQLVLNPKMIDRETSYYMAYPINIEVKKKHDKILSIASETGARIIGLAGVVKYDYALTWRAMKRNIATKHFKKGSSNYPDIVFAELPSPWKYSNDELVKKRVIIDGYIFLKPEFATEFKIE